MIIAFASKNHLGLNSELGSTISQSEYFTVVELEGANLKKVTNVENVFFEQEAVNAGEVARVIASTGADRLFVGSIENEEVTRELLQDNISVQEVPVARIADVLKSFQRN